MSEQSAHPLVSTDAPAPEPKRDPWVVTVCKAGRAAVEKALAVSPRMGATEMRVVLAVVDLTVLWSKLTEEVYLVQVAELANIGGSEENQRKATGRALRRCAQLGILVYEPGDGRGNPSKIGIPAAAKGGVESPPLNDMDPPKGGLGDPKGGAGRSERGGAAPPYPIRDLPRGSENPDAGGRATGTEPPSIGDVLASGVFDQGSKPTEPPNRPPPGVVDELLRAIARAVPAAAGRELLDDRSQGPGRTTLRALLGRLEALVGFDAAVACVAGEWPRRVHTSAMAVAIGRARARLDPPPTGAAEPAAGGPPDPPRQATLDDDSPPQPPVWESPAESARSPPPEAERAKWRQALNPTPRSDE